MSCPKPESPRSEETAVSDGENVCSAETPQHPFRVCTLSFREGTAEGERQRKPEKDARAGQTAKTAWPPAGPFLLPGGQTILLTEKTAVKRLCALEHHMQDVAVKDRYLEPVMEFDAATRANISELLDPEGKGMISAKAIRSPTYPVRASSYGPPTWVPKRLEGVIGCLQMKNLAVDRVDILSNEFALNCYVYSDGDRGFLPAAAPADPEKAPGSRSRRCSDAAIVGRYAEAVGKRLKSTGACDGVEHERPDSEALLLVLWRAGKPAQCIRFDLRVHDSLQAVAYGPSSGLLFCHDGQCRARPAMQFLMAYGLTIDAPMTAAGLEVALTRANFEDCDVLLPYAPIYRGALVESFISAGEAAACRDPCHRDQGFDKEWFLGRGSPRQRKNARRTPLSDFLAEEVDPVKLLAQQRYEELRPRGAAVADALSPARFKENLEAAVKEALIALRTEWELKGCQPQYLAGTCQKRLFPLCHVQSKPSDKEIKRAHEYYLRELNLRICRAVQEVFGSTVDDFGELDPSLLGLDPE